MQRIVRFTCGLLLAAIFALPHTLSAAEDAGGDTDTSRPAIASLPQYLSDVTRQAAEGVVAQVSTLAAALTAAGEGTGGPIDWDHLGRIATELAIVAVATLILFALLRRGVRAPVRRIGEWSQAAGTPGVALRRGAAIVAALGINAVGIMLAWLAGYALALYATGEPGAMSASQSLFLNAFLGIEGIKLLLRLVFGADHEAVRLLPIGDADAAYWDARLSRLVAFAGYGLLFAVPLAQAQLPPVVSATISMLVLLLAVVYAVSVVRRNRATVRAKLDALAEASRLGANRLLLSALARAWHWLAIAYLVALAVVIQTRPEIGLPFMALATLQSVVAIGVGLLLYNTVSGLLGRQPPLPQPLEHAFPHLRERVAFFIGPGLHVLRAAIAVAIAVTLLDAWALFDLDAWLRSEGSRTLFASVASVAFIVLMAALVWVAFASWVDRRLGTEGGAGSRERTLLSLFRNAAAIVIIVMTTMIALSEIGIEIGPLLAGAGVIGLAVGFGAQSLVQDIITGVFIQLENAVNRDDVITVGGITGVVERLSVRSVGLRDLAGTFHIVPFSQVGTVSNYMRGYAFHLGEYDIAYREDPDEALECLKAAFAELREDPELGGSVLDDLEIHGVTALSDSSVKIRVRVKTEAGMQWSVGRAYNRLVKRHLDAAGIEIPFPHMTLYFGQDKEGSAAPANLRFVEGSGDRRELPAADATAA